MRRGRGRNKRKSRNRFPALKVLVPVVVLAILAVIIVHFVNNRDTKTFSKSGNIGIYHVWNVYFEKEFTQKDFENIKIEVKDSSGKLVKCDRITDDSMKLIIVAAPQNGYTPNKKYTIEVETDLSCSLDKKKKNVKKLDFTPKKDTSRKEIVFKDKNLEAVVRENVNKKKGALYASDLERITSLIGNNRKIKNISGIENLSNLKELYLDNNEISDLKPLEGMDNITDLGLSNNKITDISSLKGLNLMHLSLSGNDIKDYSPVKDIYSKLQWKDFKIK